MNEESHSGVSLWGRKTSCISNRETIKNTVIHAKKVIASNEGTANKFFPKQWFIMHFFQQNVRKNVTRLTLDWLLISILIRCDFLYKT